MVLIILDIIEQLLIQSRRQLRTKHSSRAHDGLTQLISSKARNQVETLIHCLSKIAKL